MADKEEKTEEAVAGDTRTEAQVRSDAFVKEYGELVKRYKVDFASYPVWLPDGNGGFKCVVQSTPIDISNQLVKTPFVSQE